MKKLFLILLLFNAVCASAQSDSVYLQPQPESCHCREKQVTFLNSQSGLQLAGTLSLPFADKKKLPPCAILISGSGQQNRDEEIFGHRPFRTLACFLAQQGIATFRYDDRGTGLSDAGDLESATTLDFASDARAASLFLKTEKEIDQSRIGLIGHSEGGIIAFMLAAEDACSKTQPAYSFVVSLAGSAIKGSEISLNQNAVFAKTAGMSDSVIESQIKTLRQMYDLVEEYASIDSDTAQLRQRLYDLMIESVPEAYRNLPMTQMQLNQQIGALLLPWTRFFFSYDPATALSKITCPVLALNGDKDIQVTADDNLPVIEKAVKSNGNTRVNTKQYDGLNHLFQHCETGMPAEYQKIEDDIAPEVMKDIAAWILTLNKVRLKRQ